MAMAAGAVLTGRPADGQEEKPVAMAAVWTGSPSQSSTTRAYNGWTSPATVRLPRPLRVSRHEAPSGTRPCVPSSGTSTLNWSPDDGAAALAGLSAAASNASFGGQTTRTAVPTHSRRCPRAPPACTSCQQPRRSKILHADEADAGSV